MRRPVTISLITLIFVLEMNLAVYVILMNVKKSEDYLNNKKGEYAAPFNIR